MLYQNRSVIFGQMIRRFMLINFDDDAIECEIEYDATCQRS